LTGRDNYQQFALHFNDANIVTGGANYVAKHYPFTSAGYWWTINDMNQLIDKGATVTDISKRISGTINENTHLPDRINNFNTATQIFK
jgi:putative chitinase